MAPTAPSQAGKFKPRKPAKKITIGGNDAAAGAVTVAPDSAPSSSAAPRSDGRSGGRGRRGGRGARDGGRGGGRTGMPRAPMPQGQAFFTAQPAVATSGRQRRQSANASTSADPMAHLSQNSGAVNAPLGGSGPHLQARFGVGTEEEIVGTLECAVGSILPPATVPSGTEPNKFNRDTAQTAFERALMGGEDTASMGGPSSGLDGHWYDSDSSRDDEEQRRESNRNADTMNTNTSLSVQMPLSLPFPPVSNIDDRHADASTPERRENPLLPSFDSSGNPNALQRDKDSWFLVQLPTRLPPIQQQDAPHPTELKSEKLDDGGNFLAHHDEVAAVATAPMQVNAFDNALTNAVPGRIGTIKLYKSGKTVLVLEGANGTPSVSNGTLNCVCVLQNHCRSCTVANDLIYLTGRMFCLCFPRARS
jgi:hypothetical protein